MLKATYNWGNTIASRKRTRLMYGMIRMLGRVHIDKIVPEQCRYMSDQP